MSIIKNSNSTTNTYVTARSFHDITLGTAVDRTGQLWTVLHYIRFMSTSAAPAYYLPLNSPLYSQDTIQILARIPSSVNGYFFGASTMTISKSGNTVTWTNGSDTATATVTDWDNFHLFGFVDGKPMLDLTVLASWTITDSLRASGGAWFGACSGQTDNVSQIDIQRINIYGKASTTATVRQQKAYYPMIRLDANTSLGFFEARRRRYGVNSTGLEDTTTFHTSSSSYTYSKNSDNTPETVTYGLQLDDLHVMFGNGYHELIPTVCADGGIDDGRGWDDESASDPFVVSSKSFAFNLKGIPLAGTPISGTGVTGELMTGRKPMWSIYADNNKFGFHVIKTAGASAAQDRFNLHFNICKNNKGEWHKPTYDTSDEPKIPLELFDGYNNGAIHAPSFAMLSQDIETEYHNGVCAECSGATTFNGQHLSLPTDDNKCVFVMKEGGTGAQARFCLGNLPLWHKSTAEQIVNDENYMAVGGGIMLEWLNGGNDYELLASMMEIASETNYALSSDSSAETIAMFRDNGVTVESAFINRDLMDIIRFISRLYHPSSWEAIPLRASLALLKERTYNPQQYQIIGVSGLVKPQEAELTPVKDKKYYNGTSSTYTKSRFILNHANAKVTIGQTEYDFRVSGQRHYRNNDIAYLPLQYGTTQFDEGGVAMAFALTSGNTFLPNSTGIIALMEITEAYTEDETSGGVAHKSGDIKRYLRSMMPIEELKGPNYTVWTIINTTNTDFISIYSFNFNGEQKNMTDVDNQRMGAIFRHKYDFFNMNRIPTGSLTMIMTLYDASTAPHQWDVCGSANSACDVDCVSENPFVGVGSGSTARYFVFPSGQSHHSTIRGTLVSGHFSIWNGINTWAGLGSTPQQVSTIPNITVTLYRRACIPAHTATADSGFTQVASFSMGNTQRSVTASGYTCEITAQEYEGFRINPDGTYGRNLNGFHIAVASNTTANNAQPGDMFRVVITAQ